MTTDFFVLCGTTVPEDYTWDLGAPLLFSSTTRTAFPVITSISDIIVPTISGYAPALNVIFFNNSISDFGYDVVDYSWDFGDYYHDTNNFVTLSCASLVQHTYIMPGTYTVTLKHVQTKNTTNLDQTGESLICRGKYGIRWFWNETNSLTPLSTINPNAITWDQTACVTVTASLSSKPKWWANETGCLQKYCKLWSWEDLILSGTNPVKWSEAETDKIYQKKWMFEANDTICAVPQANFLNSIETIEQTTIKTYLVTVYEIPPVASMFSVSAAVGNSPLTVRLSPRNCRAGSFPIDRIDWDFGDGSPIKTITRYSTPTGEDVFNTGYFISDLDDVRNYDIIHTYYRNKNTYPVFYPSLTCYSANTNTQDSCSLTIGPISFAASTGDTHILKSRNTLKGNVYTFIENNNIGFVTTTTVNPILIPRYTEPPLIIRDGKNIPQPFFGYANDDNLFPGVYIPGCTLQANVLPERYLIAETPSILLTLYGALSTDDVPIKTENEVFIYPDE